MYIRYCIYLVSFTPLVGEVTYEHEVSFLSLLAQLAQEHFPGGQEHDSLHLLLASPLTADGLWYEVWSEWGGED
jgi:hypothetical protein